MEIVRWVASISGMIAAVMIASNISRKVSGYAFVMFTISSIGWITVGMLEDEPALGWQNVVLLGTNLIGIYRWLIRGDRGSRGGKVQAAPQ